MVEENRDGWGWETIENKKQFSRSAIDRISYSYLTLAVLWRVISSWKWEKCYYRKDKVDTGFSDSGSMQGFLLGYMWSYALKHHQNTFRKTVLNEWSSCVTFFSLLTCH